VEEPVAEGRREGTAPFPLKKTCRVCNNHAVIVFEDSRPFYLCDNCGLIFTDCPLSREETVQHYQSQHANVFDWHNEAKRVLEAVRFAVIPRKILDYGSGSGFLADEFRSMGYDVDNYEPMLHGDFMSENYGNNYDLVILKEVIEHVEDVVKVINRICSVTRPGGSIFIGTLMTDAIINESDKFKESFNNWWYKDDQSHISFFCQLTFEHICREIHDCDLQMVAISPNGVLLQKCAAG
jgi:SAM-dependent methyltransferase